MLRRFQILLRFSTFALRLQPFASLFGKGAPVCNENDAFFLRKGGVSFFNGAYVCSENDAGLRRRRNPRGNRRFAADRCSFTGCLFNRQPVQQATGEQATGEQATVEQATGERATGAKGNRCNRQPLQQATGPSGKLANRQLVQKATGPNRKRASN